MTYVLLRCQLDSLISGEQERIDQPDDVKWLVSVKEYNLYWAEREAQVISAGPHVSLADPLSCFPSPATTQHLQTRVIVKQRTGSQSVQVVLIVFIFKGICCQVNFFVLWTCDGKPFRILVTVVLCCFVCLHWSILGNVISLHCVLCMWLEWQ